MEYKKISHIFEYKTFGFSLVELLIAITILSILIAFVTPSLISYYRSYKFESKGREIEQAIRWAKIQAMQKSTNIGLCVRSNNLEIMNLGTNRGAPICSGTLEKAVSAEDFTISGSGASFDPRGLAIRLGNVCVTNSERYYIVCISQVGIRSVRGSGSCPTNCPN